MDFLQNNSQGVDGEKDIIIGGSVALETYSNLIGTDIDIFLKCVNPTHLVQRLSAHFPKGIEKIGPLDIWYLPDYRGYPVDLVAIDKSNIIVQTLDHTAYYAKIITPEMRDQIIWLKEFFFIINCYGAEVGGITGICCTRMAEMWGRLALVELETMYLNNGEVFIEDPVKEGRNLFASVQPHKMEKIMKHIQKFNRTGVVAYIRNVATMLESFDRVYRIRLRERKGIDLENQGITKSINLAFKELKQRIGRWEPSIDYDTMIIGNDCFVGVSLETKVSLLLPVLKMVPLKYLSEKDFATMDKKGTNYKISLNEVIITSTPPFKNSNKEFEKIFFERLEKEYIDYERLDE